MCFYAEGGWYASVSAWTTRRLTKPCRCDECRRVMPAGTAMHHLFLQEHEECRACEADECECLGKGDDHECVCPDPQYGESYDHDECDDCHKFLEAVQAVEIEAGCRRAESRPALGEMVNDINEGGMQEAKRYWQRARLEFPGLAASGYLGWLWRETFQKG